MTDLHTTEAELTQGLIIWCGVDEAGRGPLAGPVFAAAVILPIGYIPDGLNDSKKLNEKRRNVLFDDICENAVSFGIASASVDEIDELNILNATFLAMNRAILQLTVLPEKILVDGNRADGLNGPCVCVVGGDGKCASIAAASILAKVSRDQYLYRLAEEYPQYHFEKHKGYPTQLHYEMIRKFGPSPVHRKTFLRKMH